MARQEFEVTRAHLALLKRTWVSWDGAEFGAPSIDPKRPYGNGDVYGDIAEILNITPPDFEEGDEWDDADTSMMYNLHRDTAIALQIGLCVGHFTAGHYSTPEWKREWVATVAE